jgi:hypothetical protein
VSIAHLQSELWVIRSGIFITEDIGMKKSYRIRVTRDLIRAGQLLKIEVCDHVIMGNGKHVSLRTMGDFL